MVNKGTGSRRIYCDIFFSDETHPQTWEAILEPLEAIFQATETISRARNMIFQSRNVILHGRNDI